jgi:hypothetical protein
MFTLGVSLYSNTASQPLSRFMGATLQLRGG